MEEFGDDVETKLGVLASCSAFKGDVSFYQHHRTRAKTYRRVYHCLHRERVQFADGKKKLCLTNVDS